MAHNKQQCFREMGLNSPTAMYEEIQKMSGGKPRNPASGRGESKGSGRKGKGGEVRRQGKRKAGHILECS